MDGAPAALSFRLRGLLELAEFLYPTAVEIKRESPVSSTLSSSSVASLPAAPPALTFQELLFRLQGFWADRGCVLQQPFDVEVGAGTMSPETFLRVLDPKPFSVA